jgi:cystathionine beta-lyase
MPPGSDPFRSLDLDALQARRGAKWSRYGPGVLPAWVADMDFPLAPPVREALLAAVARDDLGYPAEGARSGVPEVFAARAAARWGWQIEPASVLVLPDVMRGVQLCLECFTQPGDRVVVTTPIYPPFLKVVEGMGRVVAESALTPDQQIDLTGMAALFAQQRPRLVLLCNPHNPTGRVLSAAELSGIADLAITYGALLVSDEIHADLVFEGHHVPVASLGPEVAATTVTLSSASKAFNVAGLRCAVAVTGRRELREAMETATAHLHEPVGTLGVEATLAAWTPDGDGWLRALLAVLDENRRHVARRIAAEAPSVGYRVPEATYLAWLDCRSLGLGPNPASWFLKEARVALSPGPDFGVRGEGFARLNFATSPRLLDLVLDRVVEAVHRLSR